MLDQDADIAVFVGPSAAGSAEHKILVDNSRVRVFPPIARNEICLLSSNFTKILIVDGYFGSKPAVGHREIQLAMRDRQIFGCSSLGAIRAYELRHYGMIGIGRVYETFLTTEDLMDDEIALLHSPEPYYWPLSVPLINIRFAVSDLVTKKVITYAQARSMILALKELYFGERTIEIAISMLLSEGLKKEFVNEIKSAILSYDTKQQDYMSALKLILSFERSTPNQEAIDQKMRLFPQCLPLTGAGRIGL